MNIMGFEWGWDNARALLGIAMIYGLCWAWSEKRKLFPWKVVIGATVMQFVFALILFGIPFIRSILFRANDVVDGLQAATRAGTGFVFGYVGDNVAGAELMDGTPPPLFFFQILPIVIVVAALSAMLWHWGILKWITNGFAFIFRRGMGLGGATSLAVSANVFMGMTEAPVLIRPYIKGMTRSELLIMMTAGFATIAGSVLVVYGSFLEGKMANPLAQLLTASIMAAPAAVAVALTMIPETTPATERMKEPDFNYASTMDAFSRGATDGLQIVFNIATMLIAALALLWLVNAGLGALPDVAGAPLSIERDPRLDLCPAHVHGRRADGGSCEVWLPYGREDGADRIRRLPAARRSAAGCDGPAHPHDHRARGLRLCEFRLHGHPDRRPLDH
jgi:CNT family concentrative nucleoside transporter